MRAHLPILAFVTACVPASGAPEPRKPPTQVHAEAPSLPPEMARLAAAGVTDPRFADLLVRQWAQQMADDPRQATKLGDHRFDDRLDARDETSLDARRERMRGFLREGEAIDAAQLDPADRESLALFTGVLRDRLDIDDACREDLWSIGVETRNPVSEWDDFEAISLKTPGEAASYLARVGAIARWVDDDAELLREGARAGLFANAGSVERVLALIDRQLAEPAAAWTIAAPAKGALSSAPEAERARYAAELTATIDRAVRPAIARWRATVAREILPRARDAKHAGLFALPNGARCYEARLRASTTLALGADEIHARGLADIAADDRRIAELGKSALGADDLDATIAKLRTDPALRFQSADEIQAKAESALASAKSRLGPFFNTLPKADCVVRRIPEASAPFATIAYYEMPHADGSEPGHYMINVFEPTTRTRFEAAALAFHESIPGHHLQVAIAQELARTPAFRKILRTTAFVEGWGLYAELLADEMGLYEDALDRLGMLSFDAWRAARLVVDTGLHAKGWTRDEAIAFMTKHTALAPKNIENEVDRYLVWPAQAVGYKVGQRAIVALRDEAKKELGPRFRLAAFHDVVLGRGAVRLSMLEARVRAWIREEASREAPAPR